MKESLNVFCSRVEIRSINTHTYYLNIFRNKSGFFGWKTEKTENINGYNCKVYTANNLQLVTKTRVEHLNSERAKEFLRELEEDEENESSRQQQSNLPGFLSNIFQGSQKHIKVRESLFGYLFEVKFVKTS